MSDLTIKIGDHVYTGPEPTGRVGMGLYGRVLSVCRDARILRDMPQYDDEIVEVARERLQGESDSIRDQHYAAEVERAEKAGEDAPDLPDPVTIDAAQVRGMMMVDTLIRRAPLIAAVPAAYRLVIDTLAGWSVDGEPFISGVFDELCSKPGRMAEPWTAAVRIWIECGYFTGGLAAIADVGPSGSLPRTSA